jgi:hypothetical protein
MQAAELKPGDKISYGGRKTDVEDDRFCDVYLHVGGHDEEKRETKGFIRTVNVGGITLVLRGTTEEDKREVVQIRNMCFWGSGGLIFIRETRIDCKKAIVTTGKYCKHCGAGMINLTECEWNTCDACSEKFVALFMVE